MAENEHNSAADFIALAGDITIAWLQNPNVNPGAQDVPAFLKSMHSAITELGVDAPVEPEATAYEPAVSVRSSVKPDHLVSLIDGKKYKTLKRHLSGHGLTPDEYRARYGLKSDYPMVAESYAAQRRDIAQRLGLGRKAAVASSVAAVADGNPVVAAKPVTDGVAPSPGKPKRAVRKPKAVAVEPVSAPDIEPAVTDVETVTPAPEKIERPARTSKAAPTSAPISTLVEAEAARVDAPETVVPAKARRMARAAKVQNETGLQTAAESADVEGSPKAKRATAKPKASARPKADAPAKSPVSASKKRRAKPVASDDSALPSSEA